MNVRNNVAYGRGVSDMKFSIPIGYMILNDLIRQKSKLSSAFVVTTDEETGGYEGTRYLVDKYGFKPKILIVPDGGDGLVFVNKSKGVCALKIDSKGTPAHSSRIWEGRNALEPLVKLCNEVLKRYTDNNKKESWKTTVNIGKIQGGVSVNQVCSEAYATLDFRFPETITADQIIDEVYSIAKDIDLSLKISMCSVGSPTSVDETNPIVQDFIGSFEKTFCKKIQIKSTYGASDARHFADQDIPILMIKPVGGDIHGENENVNINSCLKFYEAIIDFICSLEMGKLMNH
jgi:succinyl-diaminopimelate desuccinylase